MEPLDEPEREFRRLRRAALRQHQNESLAITGRNLFDDEASSSNNAGTKPTTPLKSLREHSIPSSASFQNSIILPAEQTGRIVNSRDIFLIQGTCTFQGLKGENPLQHIKYYLSIVDNLRANGDTRNTSMLCFFHFSLKGKAKEWLDKTSPTQITTWDQLVARFLDYFFPEDRGKLDQFAHFHFSSLTEEEEAMIHMPKGAKVLKDLLSHKEKLEKAAFLVKLSEECSAVIQRSLPQKEGDPGSFTLPCLIRPLAVKNALADL
ncbi:DNA-directed DNA polymerase [Tanacetum coccineum]